MSASGNMSRARRSAGAKPLSSAHPCYDRARPKNRPNARTDRSRPVFPGISSDSSGPFSRSGSRIERDWATAFAEDIRRRILTSNRGGTADIPLFFLPIRSGSRFPTLPLSTSTYAFASSHSRRISDRSASSIDTPRSDKRCSTCWNRRVNSSVVSRRAFSGFTSAYRA